MGSIFGGLTESLRRWWQADRIRVSSSQGRLRRLKAGDRVLLEGRIWNVLSSGTEPSGGLCTTELVMFRAVLQNADPSDAIAQGTLEVAIPVEGFTEVSKGTGTFVPDSGDRISVSDDDVTVMEAAPG
jgi:hypothetical protein